MVSRRFRRVASGARGLKPAPRSWIAHTSRFPLLWRKMPGNGFAEWLLRSVTTRELAASTVSNYRQASKTRGGPRFWGRVWGAAAKLLWRGMASEKRYMAGMAFQGLLASFVVQLFVMIMLFAISAVHTLLTANSAGLGGTSGGVQFNGPWTSGWGAECLSMAGEFFVGRWIARRAPGRELPACLALAVLRLTLAALLMLIVGADWSGNVSGVLLTDMFCFFGALTVRHRART